VPFRYSFHYAVIDPLPNVVRLRVPSAIAVAVVLITAAWAGDALLGFFGIGIPAFLAGGGLLILLIAIAMLHARQSHALQTQAEADEANDKENIAVVPLAIPLMAGSGVTVG